MLGVDAAKKIFPDLKPMREFFGEELIGTEYEPLVEAVKKGERKKDTYHVLAADFVSDEEGNCAYCASVWRR